MTGFLLLIFIIECAALLIWGMRVKGRVFEFPFLAGATFSGFVLIQLVGLANSSGLPAGALDKTLIMTILCLGMCYLGYIVDTRPFQFTSMSFNYDRLLLVGTVLSLCGAYFLLISRLPKEQTAFSGWTGLPVAYLFFALLLNYGFVIGVVLYAYYRSKTALALALFGSAFYLHRIIFAGRRAVTLELGFALVLALWFAYRKPVPRVAMLVAIPVGGIVACGIGVHQYREDLFKRDRSPLEAIAEIPVAKGVEQLLTIGGDEMRNAVYMIDNADKKNSFDYGTYHWNALVESYVPRQVVGEKMKRALMIPPATSYYRIERDIDGHFPHIGTTVSGMTGCFQSFWYFGCLEFFIVAWVMRRLYEGCMRHHFMAQIIYMIVVVQSMHCVTHEIHNFFKPWVHMSIFLFPPLFWAAERAPQWRRQRHETGALAVLPATGAVS